MNAALDLSQFGDKPCLATLSLGFGIDRGGRVFVTTREMHRCVESVTAAFVRRVALDGDADREGPIVLRSTISLLRPLVAVTEATIHMHASRMGTTSLDVRYTLVAADGGVIARADVLLVWVDGSHDRVVSLPEEVRRAVLAATPVARVIERPAAPAPVAPPAKSAPSRPTHLGRLFDAPPTLPEPALPREALPIRSRRRLAA